MSQCHKHLIHSELLTNAIPSNDKIQHVNCLDHAGGWQGSPRSSREGDKGMRMTTFGILRSKPKRIKLLIIMGKK